MIKIILAEDHQLIRTGIKLLLDAQDDLQVVGEANNGLEVLSLLKAGIKTDIVVTDITMPAMDGLELTDRLAHQHPDVKVIVLSMLNNTRQVLRAFEQGSRGYLVKNIGYQEFLFALQHVYTGGRYLCQEISMMLMDQMDDDPSATRELGELLKDMNISEREHEILQCISEGYTNVEIADKLFLSKRTVEGHRQNLIDKTGVKNTASLIKWAMRNNLLK